jgi:hypothetical protein
MPEGYRIINRMGLVAADCGPRALNKSVGMCLYVVERGSW